VIFIFAENQTLGRVVSQEEIQRTAEMAQKMAEAQRKTNKLSGSHPRIVCGSGDWYGLSDQLATLKQLAMRGVLDYQAATITVKKLVMEYIGG